MSGALRAIVRSPAAWVVGAAGFLARGGVLLFALPVWSLPTPVGVALLIPPLAVDTTGISPDFLRELVAIGAVLSCVAALALVVGALADAIAFARLMEPRAPGEGPPVRAVAARLVVVELVAMLPAIAAAVVTTGRLVAVGETEYLLPSSTSVPYVVRIVNGALPEIVALAACLLVADAANAMLSRWVLHRSWRRAVPARRHAGGMPGIAALAARSAGAWVGGWAVTALFVAPGLLATSACWPALRDTYAATLGRTPPSPAELVAVTVLFVAAWVGGVLLAGLGSAIRTAAWTFATFP